MTLIKARSDSDCCLSGDNREVSWRALAGGGARQGPDPLNSLYTYEYTNPKAVGGWGDEVNRGVFIDHNH